MLRHGDVWQAIDRLAEKYGTSPSGLARRAGLDPTTFNKSKRETAEGKLRWPSTESIAKVLSATGASLAEFVSLVGEENTSVVAQHIPVIGYAQAGTEGYFDDAGFPTGQGWDEVLFPRINDEHAYALEISGDSMEPVYRDGDIIVLSPEASLRRGDRVVVKTREGEVMAKQLVRQSVRKVELMSLNRNHEDRVLDTGDVAWMARIVWASQ
ncbi:LexA family transcriptional regulator [Ferruginivarius sediminum]|uniref:Helix-turn-helix transcriptional regulator n=1 Tax=Ferruginivarius sediminum TaxID=2661937 RepID=A0A369T6V3_9PROT|nr:helix-turn-helix transcriptional regulator [Ferruginivarius sediminum]RDD61059.1 helix-turn-helix transcriptional regulator [Ferruginivarius sediminum]